MRRKKLVFGLTIFIAIATLPAWAVLKKIVPKPAPAYYVTKVQEFSAKDDGKDSISSFAWEFQCLEPGCDGSWVNLNASSRNIDLVGKSIGKFNVKCTATYYPTYFSGQKPPTSVTSNSEILEPDPRDGVPPGAGLNTQISTYNNWVFPLYGGDQVLSGPISGIAQERITDVFAPVTGTVYPDQDWAPGSPDGAFFLDNQAGNIVDRKIANNSFDFMQCPINGVFFRYQQQNRLILKNCCGVDRPAILLTKRLVEHIRTGPNSYKIVAP